MTVLEMQSRTRPAVRWTEVCATEHTDLMPPVRTGVAPSSTPVVAPGRSIAHRRRMPARPPSAEGVRACRVETPADTAVVDDVPAWALLTCGILFGVVLLLALALLGGPAYA